MAFAGAGVIISFVVGIIIGSVTAPRGGAGGGGVADKFTDKKVVKDALDAVSSDNLRRFLQELSSEPHIAASERDRLETSIGEDDEGSCNIYFTGL